MPGCTLVSTRPRGRPPPCPSNRPRTPRARTPHGLGGQYPAGAGSAAAQAWAVSPEAPRQECRPRPSFYRGTELPKGTRPVAFIDIDEATWHRWGDPLLTPRDKLAALIRHALAGGAAAIVVDIDLSRPTGPGDADLAEALRAWLPDAKGRAPDLPPLILARPLRLPPPDMPGAPPGERATPFDALVAQAPGIRWAAPLFEQDADGKVRRWRLWAATCGAAGQPTVRPSVQLLVHALLDATPPERARLDQTLAAADPADCGTAPPEPRAGHPRDQGAPHAADHGDAEALSLGSHELHLRPHATEARIVYRLPWHLAPGAARPRVPLDGRPTPALSIRPAGSVATAADPAAAAWLKGHVVIVGSSEPGARDLYRTPIGWMPGALVMANAVHTLRDQGELRTPNLGVTIALETLLIVLMSWLFARFESFIGSLLSALAILLVLLPASLVMFRSGLWLSFVVPLVAIVFHKLFAEIETTVAKYRDQEETHD